MKFFKPGHYQTQIECCIDNALAERQDGEKAKRLLELAKDMLKRADIQDTNVVADLTKKIESASKTIDTRFPEEIDGFILVKAP